MLNLSTKDITSFNMKNSKFWFVMEWDEDCSADPPINHPIRTSYNLAWKDANKLADKYNKKCGYNCVKFVEDNLIRLDHFCNYHFFEVRSITIPTKE